MTPTVRARYASGDLTDLIVSAVARLGPFDFRWPENIEHFDHGWECIATTGGLSYQVKHGIGGRNVYGAFRVHSVTWLDGKPVAEGVATDDHDKSSVLLSLLRIGGRTHVRNPADVPIGYADFTIARHSDEIVAKYSPHGLAVKILEEDLAAWARHAILRSRSKDQKDTSDRVC